VNGRWYADPAWEYRFNVLPLPEPCVRGEHDWENARIGIEACRRCTTLRSPARRPSGTQIDLGRAESGQKIGGGHRSR
jgi:hypothetical protein